VTGGHLRLLSASGTLSGVRRTRVLLLWSAVVLPVALVATVITALIVGVGPSNSSARTRTIPGSDGIELSAYVITPRSQGRHPLVIMPAPWGSGADEYAAVGQRLAAHGYEVVSYAQRGFDASQGRIDIAGAQTQADVSAVITWALSHTAAAPGGVGAVGVSYGAGASLLAAGRDPRIKAVVAMSGWSDLAASFYPDTTGSRQIVNILMDSARASGRPDADVQALAQESASGNAAAMAATVARLSPSRSAIDDVAGLNKNRTAVMLANGFEDSIFPPSQQVKLFDVLTGPKRLQLARGDHGGPERSGLKGNSGTKVWRDATAWLDRYLRGRTSAISGQEPVQVQDVRSGTWHQYPTVSATGHAATWYLGGRAPASLTEEPAAAWTEHITAGKDSIADVGRPQFDAKPYELVSGVRISDVDRSVAAVWNGAAYPKSTLVNGAPALHVTVTPSAPNTSLYAYLYDVDGSGSGTLMTAKPYSLVGAAPGRATSVDVALEPISWTVAAGHHLSLVIDTVDPRYLSVSVPGSTVEFSSTAADPATLQVPVG
jgi:putative CocE/NonD family hydrolase